MKYKLTDTKKETIFGALTQIVALVDFGEIKSGDLGGFISKEENLSQEGNCWISGNAKVSGDAKVWFDVNEIKYICIGPFGDYHRYITITPTQVAAGCFLGTHEEFKTAVSDKYGEGFGSYSDAIKVLSIFNQ